MAMPSEAELQERARRLKLWGLLANWDKLSKQAWVREYLGVEEDERDRRSLERRIHAARLGAFKAMADFDWDWPAKIDRDQVEDLLQLAFLEDATNVVLLGPSGIGKTMIVTVRPTTSVFAQRRQDAGRHGKTERATRGDRTMAAIA